VTANRTSHPRAALWAGLILAASFAAFGILLVSLPPEGPHPLDGPLIDSFASGRSDALTLLFIGVTRLGDGWVVVLMTIAGVLWLGPRFSWTWAGFLGVAVAGAGVLNQATKRLIARVRPEHPGPLDAASGYAFPSGHAMATTALAVALFFVVRALFPRYQWVAAAAGVTFVVAVGASRVYLGVHYPTDVLAAWALGTGWVILLATATAQWVRRQAALTAPPEADR
jgi:membrane-associated phospholipid phosphatase